MYACNVTTPTDYEFASFTLNNLEKVLKNTKPETREAILYKMKKILDKYEKERA